MANGTRRPIQLENLSRDVLHLPKKAAGEFLVIGDKVDTDDKVPEQGRNLILQPQPVVKLAPEDWDALHPVSQKVIEDLIAQKRLRRTELAA